MLLHSACSRDCPIGQNGFLQRISTSRLLLAIAISTAWSQQATADTGSWLTFQGGPGPGQGKRIVLISGDEEYRSEESLPMLAKILSRHHGFDTTVLFAIDPESGSIDPHTTDNLPGMDNLRDADLIIIATRWRTPPAEQMWPLEEYLRQGKPVIGLRTATHAFLGPWSDFGLNVLGEEWVAHHGAHKKQGTRGVIESEHASHPLLRGVRDVFAPSDVYRVTHLTDEATVLLRGAVTETLEPSSETVGGKLNHPMMPLAWLRDYQFTNGRPGKAFCCTAGASVDLANADLRRLVVNACYFLVGLDVPENANVEFVDPFDPSFFGFFQDKEHWRNRGLKPSDLALGKPTNPVDPPQSPR